MVSNAEQPATCTKPGTEGGSHCPTCGKSYESSKTVEKTGHDFGEWKAVSQENCNDLAEIRVCKDCGYTEIRNLEDSLHEWEEEKTVDVEASCIHDGSRSIHCKHCGARKESEVISSIGHQEATLLAEEAACTKPGKTAGIRCNICNEILVDQESIPAKGHRWETEWTIDQEPTCATEGSMSFHCRNCEEISNRKAIPKLEHTVVTMAVVAATCTGTGLTEGSSCSVCGKVIKEQETVPAPGHQFQWVIDQEPSKEKTGLKHEECVVCGTRRNENTTMTELFVVQTVSYPQNAGALSGGGEYSAGEAVTLTAKPAAGYTFAGWILGSVEAGETPSESDIFSRKTKTEITTQGQDTVYTAYFKANSSKKLSISLGGGKTEYSCQGKQHTISNDMVNRTFPIGSQILVRAKEKADSDFLYWLDAASGRILSDSAEYSFSLGEDASLRACYRNHDSETCYLVFRDLNGKVLFAGDVEKGGTITAPETGIFTGYTFSRWDQDFSTIEKDMLITAIYERLSGFIVKVHGGSISAGEKESYSYADVLTVKAEETKNGRYFSGWYENGTRKSDSLEYTFAVTKSVELTARYEGEQALVLKPSVDFSVGERTDLDDGRQTVAMDVTWSVPEGYTFNGAGLIRTYEDSLKDSLILEQVDDTTIRKHSSSAATAQGLYEYTLTMGAASKAKNLYARAYLIYRDETTGEVITIYSDVMTSKAAGNE